MSTENYLVCPSCRETLSCGDSRGLYLFGNDGEQTESVFNFLEKHKGHELYYDTGCRVYEDHIEPTCTVHYDYSRHGWTDFEDSVS